MAHYPIELTPDDNGTFLVTCPALPEVTTWAETAEEAPHIAAQAIEEALAARISAGQDIPAWSSIVRVGAPVSALSSLVAEKVSLHRALVHRGFSRSDLQRALDWHREQVDRLFRLDHASRHDQLDAAFDALGYGRPILADPVQHFEEERARA